MPNTHVSVQEIARAILPRLANKLVFPNLCFKDYSADFVEGKGATVLAELPYYFTATAFSDGSNISPAAIKQQTVPVTLDTLATVDVTWGSLEGATSVDDAKVAKVLEGMAQGIADKINADGLALYKDIPYYVGTAGSTPDALSDFSDARKMLNTNKAPLENRKGVWDVEADAKFTQISGLTSVADSGSPAALRNGEIGSVYGIENYMSQSVKDHTKGTLAAGGTNGKITVKTAVATAADEVALDVTADANGTLTGKVVVGDILVINSKPYVVTEEATAETNTVTVSVYPQITTAADVEVTVIGSHTANLVFQERAFAYVTRPLIAPADKESYTTSFDGLTLRVVKGYDQTTKRTVLSCDVLYGYKTCIPELACRVLG